MLEVNGLSAGYQGNDVVHDVAFHVDQGEAVMIIGSNGAGKTTLFQTLCGLHPPSSGKVTFEGDDITGIPAERIARLGMRFVSAARHLFPRMTVQEHLLLGAYPHKPDPATTTLNISGYIQLVKTFEDLFVHLGWYTNTGIFYFERNLCRCIFVFQVIQFHAHLATSRSIFKCIAEQVE